MWQEPKTDWTVNDYFNYTDYNRIKNNIAYLREQALKLYINFPFTEMGVDKEGYSDFPYAEEFNAMEDNLESLKNNCGKVDGIFGAGTRAAVIAFQRAHGLSADGIVGKNTWRALLGL